MRMVDSVEGEVVLCHIHSHVPIQTPYSGSGAVNGNRVFVDSCVRRVEKEDVQCENDMRMCERKYNTVSTFSLKLSNLLSILTPDPAARYPFHLALHVM